MGLEGGSIAMTQTGRRIASDAANRQYKLLVTALVSTVTLAAVLATGLSLRPALALPLYKKCQRQQHAFLIRLDNVLTVKLMPPAYVKAYVKRNKNDAADAEAICEAVTRPSMRFVPVKDADQQSLLMLHRARSLLVRQRTMLVNALRAHMAEFGMPERFGIVRRGVKFIDFHSYPAEPLSCSPLVCPSF